MLCEELDDAAFEEPLVLLDAEEEELDFSSVVELEADLLALVLLLEAEAEELEEAEDAEDAEDAEALCELAAELSETLALDELEAPWFAAGLPSAKAATSAITTTAAMTAMTTARFDFFWGG